MYAMKSKQYTEVGYRYIINRYQLTFLQCLLSCSTTLVALLWCIPLVYMMEQEYFLYMEYGQQNAHINSSMYCYAHISSFLLYSGFWGVLCVGIFSRSCLIKEVYESACFCFSFVLPEQVNEYVE